MAIDRSATLKRCRSLGIEPGMVGISRQSKRQPRRQARKVSEYGMQLKEKQKAKTMPGVTGENLLGLLERRIDNVVYRLGLAQTRRQARQLVTHGHIRVNGKRLDIPSALVRAEDEITIDEKSRSNAFFKALAENYKPLNLPAWLAADGAKLSGTVTRYPSRDEIDVPVNEQAIVELYSR